MSPGWRTHGWFVDCNLPAHVDLAVHAPEPVVSRHGVYRAAWLDDREADDAPRSGVAPGKVTLTMRLAAVRAPAPTAPVVQRKIDAGGAVAPGAADRLERAAGEGGTVLPASLRTGLEDLFGVPLDTVRVHTGDASQAAARSIGARAYAQGQDIHFGSGQYDPASAWGQHLIAHEVAHTVQQRGGGGTQARREVGDPDDALEREADRAADVFVSRIPGQPAAPLHLSASDAHGPIRRGPDDDPPVAGTQTKAPAELVLQEFAVGKNAKAYGKLTFAAQSGTAGRGEPGGKFEPGAFEAKLKAKLAAAAPAIEHKLAALKGEQSLVTVDGATLKLGLKLDVGKLVHGIDPRNLKSWKLELASISVYVAGDVTRWLGDAGPGLHVHFEGGIKFSLGVGLQKALETYIRETVREQLDRRIAQATAETIEHGTKELGKLESRHQQIRERLDHARRLRDPDQAERAIKKGMRGDARRKALDELRRDVRKLGREAAGQLDGSIAALEKELAEVAGERAEAKAKLATLRKDQGKVSRAIAKAGRKARSALGKLASTPLGRVVENRVAKQVVKVAGRWALKAVPIVGWALAIWDAIEIGIGVFSFFKKLFGGELGGLGGGGGGKKPKNPGDGVSDGAPPADEGGPRTTEPDRGGPTAGPDKGDAAPGAPGEGERDKGGPDPGADTRGPGETDSGNDKPPYKEATGKGDLVATVVDGKLRVRVADGVTGEARVAIVANLMSGAFRYEVPRTDGAARDVFGGRPEVQQADGHTWYLYAKLDGAAPGKPPDAPVDPTRPTRPTPPTPPTSDPAGDGPGSSPADPTYEKEAADPDRELRRRVVGARLQVEIGAKVSAERRAALVAELTGGSYKARLKRADGKVDVFGGKPEVVTAGGLTRYRFTLLEAGAAPRTGGDGQAPPASPDGSEPSPVEVVIERNKAWVSVVTKDPARAGEEKEKLKAGRFTHTAEVGGTRKVWGGKPRVVTRRGRTWYVLSAQKPFTDKDMAKVREALEEGMKPLTGTRGIGVVTVKAGDDASTIVARAISSYFRIGMGRAWEVKRVFGIHLDQFDFIDASGKTIPAAQIGKQAGKKIPFKMEVSQIREIREYLRKPIR
jgi:hypothetical protein